MYDVFISHSSFDKDSFVEPLVIELKKLGLNVWYDKYSIHKGEKIKESIINGIRESVLFIAVISENYYNSNWSNLELGILEANYPENCLPLVFENVKSTTLSKYPFLLEHNYIKANNEICYLSNEINNIICEKKQESGFWHINKTDLKSLIKEMYCYNDFKLEKMAIRLSNVVKKFNVDSLSTLNEIKMIIEIIINDIAKKENIYINENSSSLDIFIQIDFLPQNLKEHIKFLYELYKTQIKSFNTNNDLLQENLYLIQYSLYSIIEWYIISYFKKPTLSQKKIIPVAPEEFTHEDIIESYNIERLVLPPELIASIDTDLEWYRHNPLTMIGARDAEIGKLIGFFNTLPITDELYEQIKNGNFDDTKFNTNSICQYEIPGFYKLYLCSLCVHPAYNSTLAFKTIYTNFIDFLLELAEEREIYISNIIADGVTPKGANLCKSIGMTKITNSIHGSEIFEATLIPPTYTTLKLKNKSGKKLIEYYQRIYSEYKEIF